jgi:hypothetical protein
MTTNLHGRIEQLAGRKFFSKKHNAYVGARHALAEKVGVDVKSIVDLEYDGMHSVGPETARKIIIGLGVIQGSPVSDSQMMHLLADDNRTVKRNNEGAMVGDRKRWL